MLKYIIKRILIAPIVVLMIIFIVFCLLYILPGSRIAQMPISGNGDALDSMFTLFNADRNLFTIYLRYCYNAFVHFNFGLTSYGFKISDILIERTTTSLSILALSIGVTLVVGMFLGTHAAIHKNRLLDKIISVVSLLFSSIPAYSLALLIALLFVLELRIFPIIFDASDPIKYLMPTLTIALGGISTIARKMRSSMIEVFEQPFTTALYAKGLKSNSIIYIHATKNALVPVLSSLGALVSRLLCGTFIVESFFNLLGLGGLLMSSISSRAYFEILGCTVVLSVIITVLNIMLDIMYAFVNPQIKAGLQKTRNNKAGENS